MPELPYALGCPSCHYYAEVSEEDPDATLSEMREHLFSKHAGYRHEVAMGLLARVRELTEAEAVAR